MTDNHRYCVIMCGGIGSRFCYRRTPEETVRDPFASPPKFADNPVLFDDDPPRAGHLNKDSEENTHE